MAETDILYGLILGTMGRMRPPPDPLRMGIGIALITVVIVVATFIARDVGKKQVSDTSKALWGLGCYLLPVISWLAYYFVVKKGISISKSGK
ncbi:MAG: hypothetical protein ACTSRG_03330 [Candidatus Helarchaeota archaeon]